jgi:hypothetical protein
MKYLITESQLDKVIFKYLDSMDLVRTEKDNKIYFKKSDADSPSMIIYDKENGVCKINFLLLRPVSAFFSMDTSDSENIIGKWVEKTLNMKVSSSKLLSAAQRRIPRN